MPSSHEDRNVTLGGRISGLIKCAYDGWLSMMTSSRAPLFSLASGSPTLNPPLVTTCVYNFSHLCADWGFSKHFAHVPLSIKCIISWNLIYTGVICTNSAMFFYFKWTKSFWRRSQNLLDVPAGAKNFISQSWTQRLGLKLEVQVHNPARSYKGHFHVKISLPKMHFVKVFSYVASNTISKRYVVLYGVNLRWKISICVNNFVPLHALPVLQIKNALSQRFLSYPSEMHCILRLLVLTSYTCNTYGIWNNAPLKDS